MSSDEDACRVCLKNEGILPIFGDDSNPDISMEVTIFGSIHLNKDDDFPKFICEDCFKQLEGAISFRNSAKRTEIFLKRRKKKLNLYGRSSTKVITETKASTSIEHHEVLEQYAAPKIDFVSVKVSDMSYIKNEPTLMVEDDEVYVENTIDDEDERQNDPEMVMLIVTDEDKKIKTETFTCKYCSLTFDSSEEYEEHRTTVEHKRNYVISFLPKKSSKCEVKSRETVNPKDQKCEICNRFFTKLHYPRHMQTQHKIKMETSRSTTKKECPICKKMFNPVSLIRHMKKFFNGEKEEKPKLKLECPLCKKYFSKHFYPLHMQRHKQGDSRNYICDQCGKKFFFKSSFCTHRLIHTNDLPHKCEYCPYRGRTKELLKIHVRTHTGDYPYKCTQCDTRCLTKSNLNSHMRRHRGPIDFICDSCNRGFYSKIQLERHISVIHYGVKNHVCSTCGATFGYRHGLMSHQRKVHKRPKGLGKPKAVYLRLEEEGLLQPQQEV
uniref:Protein krueppel n=1 Tax=Pectinophora gossypiella TaxID=13191 RepID=A0A1E1WPA8_PECGO